MRIRFALIGCLAVGLTTNIGGARQQSACIDPYPDDVPVRVTIVEVPGTGLFGDGREYVDDVPACMTALDSRRGFFRLAHPDRPNRPQCGITPNRSFRVDLSRPIAESGAVDRGVITDPRPHLQLWTRLDSAGNGAGLRGMRVGETTSALYLSVAMTGHQLRLYFNPDSLSCPTWAVHARGSTRGTVTRTSATRWDVDVPEGSVGRLLEGPESTQRLDRGLYRFRARFTIEVR
jgi:hypothetical protein